MGRERDQHLGGPGQERGSSKDLYKDKTAVTITKNIVSLVPG